MSTSRYRTTARGDRTVTIDLPDDLRGKALEISVVEAADSPCSRGGPPGVDQAGGPLGRRDSDRKQRRHLEIFLNLARGGAVNRGDVAEAMRAITEAATQAIEVERASVWLYDNRQTSIECKDLFERGGGTHTAGARLLAAEYPRYFAALESDELVVADDAHADPRTSEFSAGYLAPLGISSMLDAPIRLGGQTIGVLCHEHVGEQRSFSLEEQTAATYLAQLVSLAIEVSDRKRAERALEASHALLSATLESTADGILAVDRERRLAGFNTRFLEMWNVPDAVIASTVPGERLRFLADQTTDPEGYLRRAVDLFDDPAAEGLDVLELRDGRVFERHSKPQRMGDALIGRVWSYRDVTEQRRAEAEVVLAREQAERLLCNILPEAIAQRLKGGAGVIADSCADVSVLFADIVGFTALAGAVAPGALVDILNRFFSEFDLLAERHGVEKIKTIGDSYMAAAGVPVPRADHAEAAANLALSMLEAARSTSASLGVEIELRIGIHSGPVVAGVIGLKRLIYDLWGDTVNTASRMESHGVAGGIQITEATRARLGPSYLVEDRGLQEIKGKGEMRTFLLLSREPAAP
jgi:class 3 adenylate cyclase/PAS domain-containing protein